MPTRWRRRLPTCSTHAEVRFAAVEDQEQVDKILSVAERLPSSSSVLYDETRGLRDYDHARLHAIDDGDRGRAQGARRAMPRLRAWLDAEIAAGKGSDPSVMLYTSGTTGTLEGRGAQPTSARSPPRATRGFRQADRQDEVLAYLPLAWVGDHYLNYAQGLVAGFCIACPESAETAMADLREIGPTFYFAPPRVFEKPADARDDPHGGRGRAEAALFHYLHRRGAALRRDILDGSPCRSAARLLYRARRRRWSTGR